MAVIWTNEPDKKQAVDDIPTLRLGDYFIPVLCVIVVLLTYGLAFYLWVVD